MSVSNSGERLVTEVNEYWTLEHLHRYALALNHARDKVVLDIACGEGYGSSLLSSVANYVYGVDISLEAISHARIKYTRDTLEFKQGSAFSIPIDDDSIDLVVCFETIEHHDFHREMLLEFKRVLRKNGKLLISTPDKVNYTEKRNYNNPFHVHELYKEEFADLIADFFNHRILYYQKALVSSLIVPDGPVLGYEDFEGDFNGIKVSPQFSNVMYNIILASDAELSSSDKVSFFSNSEITEKYFNSLKVIYELVKENERLNLIARSMPFKVFNRFSQFWKRGLNYFKI